MATHGKQRTALTGEKFDAMSDAERKAVIAQIEAETPEQRQRRARPLSAREKAWWKQARKKTAGRPRLGSAGTKIVSITVEKSLLKRIDAYAKTHGLKRSELFSRGAAREIGTA